MFLWIVREGKVEPTRGSKLVIVVRNAVMDLRVCLRLLWASNYIRRYCFDLDITVQVIYYYYLLERNKTQYKLFQILHVTLTYDNV